MTVAALFVEPHGVYSGLDGVELWDKDRDARKYEGPHPVVAHPPCYLWVNMAAVNWKRYQRELPAWYAGGSDGGCFSAALLSLFLFCGVLEHPAGSHAWEHFCLPRPLVPGWAHTNYRGRSCYVCEVWQSAYGHRARKRTWLLFVGPNPPRELRWSREPGTAQVGWFDRIKPTVSKKEASATPPEFATELLALARSAKSK